jgi:hypothetical protein
MSDLKGILAAERGFGLPPLDPLGASDRDNDQKKKSMARVTKERPQQSRRETGEMGTWGAGNFDSDYALDFLDTEVQRHVDAIERIFADDELFQLDEDAEAVLVPSVFILSLLCEHCRAHLPATSDVAQWKARYLAMYDQQIDAMEATPGFKDERRFVIAATFDRLAALTRD